MLNNSQEVSKLVFCRFHIYLSILATYFQDLFQEATINEILHEAKAGSKKIRQGDEIAACICRSKTEYTTLRQKMMGLEETFV